MIKLAIISTAASTLFVSAGAFVSTAMANGGDLVATAQMFCPPGMGL